MYLRICIICTSATLTVIRFHSHFVTRSGVQLKESLTNKTYVIVYLTNQRVEQHFGKTP